MSAAVHRVRLASVAGAAGPTGAERPARAETGAAPGAGPMDVRRTAVLFEAQVSSAVGTVHGLLAAELPAGSGPAAAGPGYVDEHLALDLTRTSAARWHHQADVLHAGRLTTDGVLARLRAVLATYPGCALATAEHRAGALLLLARDGAPLVLQPARAAGEAVPPLAVGSMAHAWLTLGRRLAELARVDVLGWHSPVFPRSCFRAVDRPGGRV